MPQSACYGDNGDTTSLAAHCTKSSWSVVRTMTPM